MANPDNITLRSEKGSFLTFEEMDLNLTELQNQLIEYNSFISTQFNPLDADHDDLRLEWTNYQITTDDRLEITEQNIVDINNDQTVQDGRISQNESDILALQLGGGLTYNGNYDVNDAPYSVGDVVTYTDGLDYISVSNNNTQEPSSGTNTNYWIVLTAKSIAEFTGYDNSVSGLTATDVQSALDEVQSNIESAETTLTNQINSVQSSSISDFGDPEWTLISTNTTLTSNSWYEVDFSTGPLTLTLPASPSRNDMVRVYNSSGDSTDSVIARNGQTIMGLSEDMTLDMSIASLKLTFNGTDWRIV